MKKKSYNFLKMIVICILVQTLAIRPVSAETDPNWGSQTPHIGVSLGNYNNTWKVPMNDAGIAWNGTPTRVTVGISSSSSNKVLVSSYSDTWYGLASSANPGPFTIKLNSRTITKDASNFTNFVKSTLVHEYGHIFCLDHTTRTSIMNSSRNRNTMTTPQQFDIDEVNSVYK